MAFLAFFLDPLSNFLQKQAGAGISFLGGKVVAEIGKLVCLNNNSRNLAIEIEELRRMRDDLVRSLENEERERRMKRTHKATGWVEHVELISSQVDQHQKEQATEEQEDASERSTVLLASCHGGISFECLRDNYELGGKVADLLGEVRQLKDLRGNLGDQLVSQPLPDAVKEVPRQSPFIVGSEDTTAEIRRCLHDDRFGIIGVYGLGGVGKTALLTEINNEFLVVGNSSFDLVIWVTVTKDPDILRIQDDIGVRFGYSRRGDELGQPLPKDKDVRTETLYQCLSKKRFLILLDDTWEKLDLKQIGIPHPSSQNKSKIVLATRFVKVCDNMDADNKVRIPYLNADESWELFSRKVGITVDLNTPSIKPHAEAVVAKCGGLPLALVTVGRAMANAKTLPDWKYAVEVLNSSPDELGDMDEGVFLHLKLSLDRLKDESLRQCLLYCSLFPETHDIQIEQLIEYWIGEGLLNTRRSSSILSARTRGRGVILDLKNACLLESGNWGEDRFVKLHDIVRKMAIRLTGGDLDESNIFLVDAGQGFTHVPRLEQWTDARRVSLLRNNIQELPRLTHRCGNLQTLLITGNRAQRLVVPDNFFKYMPVLRVLDLSYNHIEELPGEIGLLVELQYLNLSSTRLKSLPKELGKLARLRQLNLMNIFCLRKIPREALVTLKNLQTLNLYCSGYYLKWEVSDGDGDSIFTTQDLESLTQMEELGVDIVTSPSLEQLVASARMYESTQFLRLSRLSDISSSQLTAALDKLDGVRDLSIGSSPELEELRFSSGQLPALEVLAMFGLDKARIAAGFPQGSETAGNLHPLLPRLRRLVIKDCHGFAELTWVRGLPCLEYIELKLCEGIVELLADGEEAKGGPVDCSFPKLKVMRLRSLPKLRMMSGCALLLSQLEVLEVSGCPELKTLSLGPQSLKNIKEICGGQEWWDGLEWDEQDNLGKNKKNALLPYFKPISE